MIKVRNRKSLENKLRLLPLCVTRLLREHAQKMGAFLEPIKLLHNSGFCRGRGYSVKVVSQRNTRAVDHRQNCHPETLRSTSVAGVRSVRLETRARCSARRPAPPSPAAVASRSKDADTSPAGHAHKRRCRKSTESLPTSNTRRFSIHGQPPLTCLGGLGSGRT